MASKTLNYLAGGPDGQIRVKTSVRAIGRLEAVVRITHCGVCGTDSHDRTHGCGLGHEGVGFVEEIGPDVTAFQVGQRCCGDCRECSAGYRQYCPNALGQKYGELEQGAFGDYVVRHQDFLYPIPDRMESKHAAPLLCAGGAVFGALCESGTQSTDRVGVVGLGGLGHLAVMYARAMGCEVVTFSTREEKRADAIALGATEFRLLQPDGQAGNATPANLNVILLCGGQITNLDLIMPLLAPRAKILPLVIQGEPIVIPYLSFLIPGHRIIANTSATREKQVAALTFADRHNIKPWVEEYPMSADGLAEALTVLASGRSRYRGVLSSELQGASLK
ncbi:NADP-dependent alcohol dehydrogenase [Thozetella sp. PMI_491]|nr:NADP-dependent alcohol dehydrogenase [Thozetella sp. PMI_491]